MPTPQLFVNSKFYLALALDGSQGPDGYFMECKGFKRTQDVVEACEVTSKPWGKASHGQVVITKIPGNAKSGNIVLRRGLGSIVLWHWFEAVEQGNWAKQLRNGSLTFYNPDEGKENAIFQFQGAWPISYNFSDTHAAQADLVIEELEIAVTTFTRVQ